MIKAKDIFRGVRTIAIGMIVPAIATVFAVALHYPLGAYDCYKYGTNKEVPSKYSYFECYIKDGKRGWLTKQEYQSSVIGARLIVEHLND